MLKKPPTPKDIERAKAKIEKAQKELEVLMQAYKETCTHPMEFRTEFQWHHGYGHYVTGDRCKLCGLSRPWKSGDAWGKFNGMDLGD